MDRCRLRVKDKNPTQTHPTCIIIKKIYFLKFLLTINLYFYNFIKKIILGICTLYYPKPSSLTLTSMLLFFCLKLFIVCYSSHQSVISIHHSSLVTICHLLPLIVKPSIVTCCEAVCHPLSRSIICYLSPIVKLSPAVICSLSSVVILCVPRCFPLLESIVCVGGEGGGREIWIGP